MCDYDVVDVEVEFDDYKEGVWYLCVEEEDEEFGEACGFEYALLDPDGDRIFEICDEDDPEAE